MDPLGGFGISWGHIGIFGSHGGIWGFHGDALEPIGCESTSVRPIIGLVKRITETHGGSQCDLKEPSGFPRGPWFLIAYPRGNLRANSQWVLRKPMQYSHARTFCKGSPFSFLPFLQFLLSLSFSPLFFFSICFFASCVMQLHLKYVRSPTTRDSQSRVKQSEDNSIEIF